MAIKIITVGNPFLSPDNCSYRVLQHKKRFKHFIWVEGGVGGLSLIDEFTFKGAIYIIDYMPDIPSGTIIPLKELDIPIERYDHNSAFYYLLALLQQQKCDHISLIACQDPQKVLEVLERL